MNSVGIDISKGRSTVAVMRPFGEVVISPFEVRHTDSEPVSYTHLDVYKRQVFISATVTVVMVTVIKVKWKIALAV